MNNQKQDIDVIVEASQSVKTQLALIAGICICGLSVLWAKEQIGILKESGWFIIVIGNLLILYAIFKLLMSLFLNPQKIIINKDIISLVMLFNRRQNINVCDILRLEYSSTLSLIVNGSGWLVYQKGKKRCMIAKQFFSNFDDLVAEIKRKNPLCVIDENIMKWERTRNLGG